MPSSRLREGRWTIAEVRLKAIHPMGMKIVPFFVREYTVRIERGK
ncbi:MAG: hypothetical protein ACK56Q_04540 [Pirellulaceae bacterium]